MQARRQLFVEGANSSGILKDWSALQDMTGSFRNPPDVPLFAWRSKFGTFPAYDASGAYGSEM